MLKKIKKKGWYTRFDKDYLAARHLPLLLERRMYITKKLPFGQTKTPGYLISDTAGFRECTARGGENA